MKTPKNIWVYKLKNGQYSFGEYINAKKRVFLRGKLDSDTAIALSNLILNFSYNNNGRQVHFTGAMIPTEFIKSLPCQARINY